MSKKASTALEKIVLALLLPAIWIFGYGVQLYADHRYITITSTLEAQLYEYQEKIWLLERQDSLTEDEKDKLEFYQLKEQELEQKVN